MAAAAPPEALGPALDPTLDSTLPLWFKPEKFLEPEFSPEAYVADLKRYVPLETLRGELQSHVSALKARLVEVVNEDYNDFVSLSTKLVNVDGAVLRMQRPLLELKEQLEAARVGVVQQAGELQEGLARRQAVAAARELLELMQDTAHVMSKVEKLMGEVQPLGRGGGSSGLEGGSEAAVAPEDLEGQCRLLDRVCSEVSRLNFFSAKGQDLALIRKLQPRIDAAAKRLQSELDQATRAALAGGNSTALAICLHAYASLGAPQAAEQVVREALVAPTVRAAVAAHKVSAAAPAVAAGSGPAAPAAAPSAGPQQAAAQLSSLLPALVKELEARLGGVLGQALASSASSQAFDFLGGAVLPEIVGALEESLPGVFSPGVPSLFHANYQATMRLLDALEAQCISVAQVQQFRRSAAYHALLKKWNLPVYFSLRFQDIAGGLEGQLASPSLDSQQQQRPAGSGGEGVREPALALAPSRAVWKGLQRCLEPDVFLTQLADRFVRLAMQLLARYATWAQQGMQQRARAQEAAAAQQAQQTQQQQQQQQQQAGEQPAKPEPTWSEAATPEQLALLAADLAALQEGVMDPFVPQLQRLLRGLGQEPQEAAVLAFLESGEQLRSAGSSVLGALGDTLTEQCVVVLRQLRGIVATFRMTKRAQPDRPSHYVSAILAPLQTFLSGEAAGRLGPEARAHLTQAVVAGVSVRYQQLADDTLSTVRKTESSLKRLKTRQKLAADGGEGGAGAAPDTDKMIAMQLLLDVQEFGRLAGAAGVDLAGVEAYQQLWDTVSAQPEEEAAAS